MRLAAILETFRDLSEPSPTPLSTRTPNFPSYTSVHPPLDTAGVFCYPIHMTSETTDKYQDALEDVLNIHTPEYAPRGYDFMGHDGKPICNGCNPGDPYLAPDWPCDTVNAIYKHLPQEVEGFYHET